MEGALTRTTAPRWAQPGDLAIIATGTTVNILLAAALFAFAGRDSAGTELALRMTARVTAFPHNPE